MAKYIDREAAIKQLHDVYEYDFPTASGVFDEFALKIVPSVLKSIPAADVVPVVWCKDCANGVASDDNKYIICCNRGVGVKFDDFCSYGKRKEV